MRIDQNARTAPSASANPRTTDIMTIIKPLIKSGYLQCASKTVNDTRLRQLSFRLVALGQAMAVQDAKFRRQPKASGNSEEATPRMFRMKHLSLPMRGSSIAIWRTMSGMGHKPTSITRLQMVRFSLKSGHWASVCLLSGVKRTKINDPQNVRS